MWWRKYNREYFRKLTAPYLGNNPKEKAAKYTAILRCLYFFSTTTLALYLYKCFKDSEKIKELEAGRPVMIELNPAYRRFQQRAANAGMVYKFSDDGTLEKVEFDKEQYFKKVEEEALEKAKQAQEKALAEGRELPDDAIRLV